MRMLPWVSVPFNSASWPFAVDIQLGGFFGSDLSPVMSVSCEPFGLNICGHFLWEGQLLVIYPVFSVPTAVSESHWITSHQCYTPTLTLEAYVERKARGHLRDGRKLGGNSHVLEMLSLHKEFGQVVTVSAGWWLWGRSHFWHLLLSFLFCSWCCWLKVFIHCSFKKINV